MSIRFAEFELDRVKFELRRAGVAVSVEPQVLAVLLLLVENRDRLVTRDELIDAVWNGRIVSDAAVSSRIRSARQVLGDDGTNQRMIKTVHGRGFRFAHPVATDLLCRAQASEAPASASESALEVPSTRPSIAVLPFEAAGDAGPHAVIGSALAHELIAELSRLRWLFVIARGSSFRLRAIDPDIRKVGAVLGVTYCLSGTLEVVGSRILVAVELADTRDQGIVWSERYDAAISAVHDIRSRIAAATIAALELQIPLHEAQRARLSAPENLDAWSSYHLGLQRMFRFNNVDNAAATAMFERALAIEPSFARAHAGLSFTRFQNAFLNYTGDVAAEAMAARRHAERAVEIDALDPFSTLTMGRSHWLTGDVQSSLCWLDRAVTLNPNYAQGLYSRAFAETLLCEGASGQADADEAMLLSPIDPMHYAMLGTRALSHVVRGNYTEAARWGDRAARAPGAHVLIAMIAVASHALNDDNAAASAWAANIRRISTLRQADFFRSFPFDDPAIRSRIASGLTSAGIT